MNNEKLKEAEIKFGNPLYVYDLSVIEDQFKELNNGFRSPSSLFFIGSMFYLPKIEYYLFNFSAI